MGFKQSVFLILNRRGVVKMTKTVPALSRGEICVKVNVSASDTAFREPTLVREIVVTDPFDGLIPDIDFEQPFITETEAQQIKAQRVMRMIGELQDLGYEIRPPVPPPAEPFGEPDVQPASLPAIEYRDPGTGPDH